MELATVALGTLLPKLAQLLQQEHNLHKGARKDVEILSKELQSIHAALCSAGEVPTEQLSELVRIWARDVRDLSYNVEDVVDAFLARAQDPAQTLSKRSAAKRFITKIANVFTKKTTTTRHDIEQEIEKLKESVRDVAERRDRHQVDAITPAETVVDPRLTEVHTERVNELVGIDEAMREVIARLAKGDDQQKRIVVSIAGFAGLGKTTLARAVYGQIQGQFDCTAFVSVTGNPDTRKLLKDLLYQFDKEKFKEIDDTTKLDETHLKDLVREIIQNKRYLIVLDDMWDTKPWEIIQHIVHENGLKSRIITTTRRFDVAEQVGGCYRLKHLTHESSKILFFGRIFGSGGKCPTKFSEISENILKKCAGVPLAIIATSKTLLANNSEDIKEWCHVSDSLGSGLGSSHGMDTIRKTQFLSYYDLPSQLKVCLLYLSIFPEEYKIRRDRLIWRWIAEDFVQHGEEDQSLFELGESYFNELVNRNLIQPIPANDEGTSWACAVHDMVLDLICLLSREEGFVTTVLGDSKQSTPDDVSKVRRLALHTRNEQHNYGDNMDVAQPQLRSLDAMGCPTHMIPSVSRFLLLRVLDLESCRSIEGYDLKHLGKLLLLRFLGLSNTFVRKLPEEIGNLKFLQTLELERSGVEELPASMGGLRGLMCLNADWTTSVPDWIGKLTSLQQLVMYPSFGDENSARWFAKELGNLRELRVLRFLIKTRDEGQLRDLLESLSNLKKVQVLHFHYYGVQLNNRAVLLEPTEFALSKTLCFLELHLLEFSRRPSWINPQDLPHLRHLWLMVFDAGKQDLGILGGFPELRHLHLLIANTERGDIITCDGSAFLNLKFCSITKPLLFVYGAMPRLEVLDFHFDVRFLMGACHNFDFDFGMGNLHSLQRVIVQIRCVSAFPEEVAKAEAAVRDAIHLHTNRPTLEISLFGQRMETFYADLNQNTEKTDEPREEVLSMLSMVDSATNNTKMKILSIVRSEGLGETTLAEEVFDMASPQFDCGAFVRVGQNADLKKVLTDILIGLDKKKYKDLPTNVLDLLELIRLFSKSLINKRFFIVVDDIWDLKEWDIIKCGLVENYNGSTVLTTSRSQVITTVIGGSSQLLPTLPLAKSKQLFYKKLFGSEDKCPPHLENICEELIESCGGIVSVITETVELLSSVPPTLEDWHAVYVKRKLVLSYDDLPGHLRNCLLYFSMFPKGYEISGERLAWAWIAEGFIQETEGQTLRDVAERYLSELVMRKMIEAVEVDAGGKALSCRLHDLVQDFVIAKSSEENFAAILEDYQDIDLPETVHRLSIQGSTRLYTRSKSWLCQVKSVVIVTCDIMPSISFFPGLRVLDLGGCDSLDAADLNGIHNSFSLRYLVIGSKCITRFPKEIVKLKYLQTLDLSACGLNELPESILLLRNLECLWVNSHMKIPDGIGEISALQELGDINIWKPETILKDLLKLSKLRVLRIAIWSWDDECLKNTGKQLWDNLCSLVQSRQNILSLSILTCCSLEFMHETGQNWPPQSLQKLEIHYSAFYSLPGWFHSLLNISSLTIEVCKLSQVTIDVLGKLPALCSLSLKSKRVPEGIFFIDPDSFKKLESLKLASDAMKEMFAPHREATQQLKRLTVVFQASRARDINEDFSFGLENLPFLEHVRVEIICYNATHRIVNDAEAAVREAISRNRSSNPDLEVRRVQEDSMIEETEILEVQQESVIAEVDLGSREEDTTIEEEDKSDGDQFS